MILKSDSAIYSAIRRPTLCVRVAVSVLYRKVGSYFSVGRLSFISGLKYKKQDASSVLLGKMGVACQDARAIGIAKSMFSWCGGMRVLRMRGKRKDLTKYCSV